ncbi:MAG: formate dehydrogenase accessory sulfurtransferase FdhD [Anaerolineaceae bacterium]|nr:formate dehydrogenase accessory sulfurtransferase FdhD [Anaerolineaceae bacterium]
MSSVGGPATCFQYQSSSGWEEMHARVIIEASVDLAVNGEPWLSFSCTPTDLDALGLGFLFNEGLIQQREEVAVIDVCRQNTYVDIWLNHPLERPKTWQRTSGCTGGATTPGAPLPVIAGAGNEQISPDQIFACMDLLLKAQELYHETGGVHCSLLTDGQKTHLRMEDIGRHNTIDKLAGKMLLQEIRISPAIIVTTGRVSSEMLQKSARMGAIAVISRTSPTSQSVDLAAELGITLVGYARRNKFIAYTHPERLFQVPLSED